MAIAGAVSTIMLIFILCSALASCNIAAATAAGGSGGGRGGGAIQLPRDTIFNVMDFGAKPNSKKESTMAFIKAWNAACKHNGRSRVFIPPGVYQLSETIFAGPCAAQTVTIYVGGTLKAVTDISLYSGQGWISFESINGLILTGGGTFDGQGQDLWQYNDCKENPDCVHLPASLYFNNVNDTKFMRVNLVNSMGFHMHLTNSVLFRAHSLNITAPETSPNTDGLHISKSTNVKLSRSVIRTGDDCVSIGQGSTNVTINKVTCGPGHGISIGSLGKVPNELDVSGIIVKNCTLVGTTNGLRIKTYAASDASKVSGVLFSDIVFENVQNPIIIDQNYGSKVEVKAPSQVKISDVIYQDIRGTTVTPNAVNLMCSSSVPCSNVRLSNVDLKPIGNTKLASSCANARVTQTGIVIPPPCK